MATRPLTFDQAKARYVHRYTMEHVPAWARKAAPNGRFYAPQHRTDREWYDNAVFPGEERGGIRVHGNNKSCVSIGETWPLGHWLDKPYSRNA